MERYDNIVKSSEIRKLVDNKMYQKALVILETMNVSKVKMLTDLSLYAEVYLQTERYEEAERLLLRLRSKSNSRRVIKQLIRLALRRKDEKMAEKYYEEYIEVAPHDIDKYILRYRIDRMKEADIDVLIGSLEALKEYDYIEKWCYELAKLYCKAGRTEECIKECSELILWFGKGIIVDKAKMLKSMCEQPNETPQKQVDNLSKNQKILENHEEFEYNHKSLQDIPKEGNVPENYEYIYNHEQIQAILKNYWRDLKLQQQSICYLSEGMQNKEAVSFMIAGPDAASRTAFAKAMAKAIHELKIYDSLKIAKINALRLNELELTNYYESLRDSFVIIEQASALSVSAKEQIATMAELLRGHLVVILQDEADGLELARKDSESFASFFETMFSVKEHSADDLMEMALAMFHKEEFALENEAMQCLMAACNHIALEIVECEREERLQELINQVLAKVEERSMREVVLSDGHIDYHRSYINKIIASDF